MEYGQFCPVAKAMEILGEKWTVLILRELHMGGSRFSELQRGLCLISPTILTKRLNDLADAELILRKRIPGQRGYEYFLTQAGKETLPIIKIIGEWGMCWARGDLRETDLDVELLMLYLQRSIQPDNLPGNQTVIQFHFTNLKKLATWWLIVKGDSVDICLEDPGQEVDIYFTTNLRTMIDCWMGDENYQSAIADGRLNLVGPSALTRNIQSWLSDSIFAGIRPAHEI
ncbi:MAG: transcriptional regulator [gamma proteobacterium symbiont of Ctena orbiculata]|nr:winged helix-turn-helix transcriptional regulator [Candidatus Thiodiazotropha taylori]MBT3060433.1 winged helix-turn-helix transcriptional regulator [Candidatus Thiodiazotropha sp. (ex Lucina pensylvanica)]MBV2095069.1 winged helix-turn-helix transcriptional regulator [Candidatus Thiodiazotropha sp. (ex Codakia orbicularis)]PUB73776.1 MAG: transcriptional regulator [gamma proteobacterium symbiont of Ctena orbiculata]MBT3063757.1 winged helix-turn-helix transcriptional regulator [Candidatus T